MVAVVSGSGLGLFGSSISALGGAGAAGNANVGRGGDRAYVNTATGNLIVQSQDEVLSALGLDLALVRTYNSQGLMNDDNGDNWRLGVHQRVYGLSGTLNAADSTITKVFGDGREVVYRYDAARSAYVSSEGEGAHDTLEYAQGEWTWTDGSGRNTETYNAEGQLTASTDADGHSISYTYDANSGLLTQIIDGSGQITTLTYSGNNLAQISVSSGGQTQTLTRYFYDAEDRLRQVVVDLTPSDNAAPLPDANADGLYETTANQTYITTYTYDGTSRRIATITQSDGSSVAFTYQLADGEYRVRTYTDAEGRVTTLTYSQGTSSGGGSGTVTVDADTEQLSTSDSETTTTTHELDEGVLTQPPAEGSWDDAFLLESSGTAANDARIAFDANGNGFTIWRAGGNLFVRQYNSATNTISEPQILDSRSNTVYAPALAVDADGNAMVGWVQSDGTANSVWASYYDAQQGAWNGAVLLESSAPAAATATFSLSVAVRGNRAGVAWLQSDGTRNNLYFGGMWDGEWFSPPDLIESSNEAASQPSVSIDADGNAAVVWRQSDGTANSIYVNRWDNDAYEWSGPSLLETSGTAANDPKVGLDGEGNAIAIWRASNNVYARRYSIAEGTWSPAVLLDNRTSTVQSVSLSVDEQTGNAIAAWVQSDGTANSAYVAQFDALTQAWSSPTLLEQSAAVVASGDGNLVTTINSESAAVAWLQTNGSVNRMHVSRLTTSGWSEPTAIDTEGNAVSGPAIALDRAGNLGAVWRQSDGTAESVYGRLFRVPDAPTYDLDWQALTPGDSGPWPVAEPIAADSASLVKFNSSGHGFAVWSEEDPAGGTRIYARRYNSVTNTWSEDSRIDDAVLGNAYVSDLVVDESGNAVVSWLVEGGAGIQLRTNVFLADASAWSGTLTVSDAATPAISLFNQATIGAGVIAFSWIDMSVTSGEMFVRAAVLTPDGWTAPFATQITNLAWQPVAGIDGQGNVVLAWDDRVDQGSGENFEGVVSNVVRYSAASGTWSNVTALDADVITLSMQVDEDGNALRLSTDEDYLYVHRFDASTNAWGTRVTLGTFDPDQMLPSIPSLTMAASGDALVAWSADGTLSIREFDAATGTWSPSTQIVAPMGSPQPDFSGTDYISTSMVDNAAVVAWLNVVSTDEQYLYAVHLNNGEWSDPVVVAVGDIETFITEAEIFVLPEPVSARMAANGMYAITWRALDEDGNPQAFAQTFNVSGAGPSFTVPAGATWQSIANALYGIDSVEAGEALRDAMGNPGLLSGTQLTGFPASITLGISTSGAPYYTVLPGATWQSIAAELYGIDSAEAGEALRVAVGDPSLAAGTQLTGLPELLQVTTTQTTTVPPYYTVEEGDTWEAITQAIYGTSDSDAIEEFQSRVGTVELTVGMQITVPLTLEYSTTSTGSTQYLQTDVQDALGYVTTYLNDASGRLTGVLSPTTGGVRLETRYEYDADGNVTSITEDPAGLNRVTTLGYDAQGNLLSTRDSLGNTVTRTYNSNNQLLSEVRYVVPDADGAGTGQPGTPLTTRYVYDGEHHLRFAISADGRVTEHQYNAAGQRTVTFNYLGATYTTATSTESELNTWAGTRRGSTERIDYGYDFRGNVSSISTWNAVTSSGAGSGTASISRFVYDQRGRLLQTIDPRGETTTGDATDHLTAYTYDGLGRILTSTQWIANSNTTTTVNAYDDASRIVRTTLSNGLITTSTYNRSGELISVVQGTSGALTALGSTMYSYDANGRLRMSTDPTGVRQHLIYDEAGRKVGAIDGDGTLIEFIYDPANQLIKTVQYASAVSSAALASLVDGSGNPTNVALSSLRPTASGQDRITRQVYDQAGRLTYTIDEVGAVTQFFYDGAGRITDEVKYARTISVPPATNQILPADLTSSTSPIRIITDANDRRVRNLYDNSGTLAGTLDAAGYLIEYVYDNAGKLSQQIAYANQASSALWLNGTLAQLRTSVGSDTETTIDPEQDIRSYFFYDGKAARSACWMAKGI